jgi:hypothetical protein
MKRLLSAGLALFLVAAPAWGQTTDVQKNTEAHLQKIRLQKAAVAYLEKLQQKDGGFAPDASAEKSTVAATNACVRAVKYLGGEVPNKAACADFVRSCIDKDTGGFADAPGGKVAVNSTAVGVLAAVELDMPRDAFEAGAVKYLGDNVKGFEDVRIAAAAFEALGKRPAQADAWLEQIVKLRNDDGYYGKDDAAARDTGSAVAAVLRLGGKVERPEVVIKPMQNGQRADGGFGEAKAPSSDLATSYRIMRSLHMLKAPPQDAGRLRAFIDSCRNDDGGFGVARGKPSSAAGTYYATIITHWLDEK